MKTLFIGYRVQDMGGFAGNDLQTSIKEIIGTYVREHKDIVVLTSLNLGIETWAAQAALDAGVPYHVYIPFTNPHQKWPLSSRKLYTSLLHKASRRVTVDEGEFAAAKMQAKDIRMIDDAEQICGFFNGRFPLLKFIERANKSYVKLMPEESVDDGFYISL